jgi:hypothetical protein
MIRPLHFGYNLETAMDNIYQKMDLNMSPELIVEKAQNEFDQFVDVLEKHKIQVIQFSDHLGQNTPDSLFPNNWISTHSDGHVFVYPMFSKNRRKERRKDILHYLKRHFKVKNIVDNTSCYEAEKKFLEGTGSMVLDRENKIAYGSISQRTNKDVFVKWCKKMNFRAISFVSQDSGTPIYHTNVLMSICQKMVFICLDAIVEKKDKEKLISLFKESNKEVVDMSIHQMNSFLGNVLELKNETEKSFLVMSTSAFNSLSSFQKKIISKHTQIIHSSLDTIEYFGGGSARCMMAEIFLKSN